MGLGLIIQRRSQFPLGDGRNGPEWPAGMDRNRWPECVGIRNCNHYSIKTIPKKTCGYYLEVRRVDKRLLK